MRKDDPLPAKPHLHQRTFYVGRDRRGRWVVQDSDHLCGGLFVSRAAAFKFALFETGHQPQAIISVADALELDFDTAVLGLPHPDMMVAEFSRRVA
jgi:hypothetical protein